MFFNSSTFVGFFAVVYCAYLLCYKNQRAQNLLLLIASYVFYGNWDARFLALLAFSTVVDFVVVQKIDEAADPRRRRLLLASLVTFNLSILGVFKYLNFFVDSFATFLTLLGLRVDPLTLNIVLPVGISFYTFHELSYATDVYRKEVAATRNLVDYALFVAFSPLLVAGPITRASHLLPQIANARTVERDRVNVALVLILWGYFKKVVIADNVAVVADEIFDNYQQHEGLDLLTGMLAFTVQIYCDFSGYSDIARGIAALMGFHINLNFNLPYFAQSPSDFWKRWHISLSSWLRDYLYIPLGGNKYGLFATYRNLAVTMLLGGLWHGAAWNYVLWGAYHGGILIGYRSVEARRTPTQAGLEGHLLVAKRILVMFVLTVIGWVLFRSKSASQIVYMLSHVSLATAPGTLGWAYIVAFYSLPLILVQLAQYRSGDLLILCRLRPISRVIVYSFLCTWILIFGVRRSAEFIYFQF